MLNDARQRSFVYMLSRFVARIPKKLKGGYCCISDEIDVFEIKYNARERKMRIEYCDKCM
jgi:hypothetical protein